MVNPPLWTETPLLYSSKISETLGVSAYLKLENLHPSHSFKYRGLSLFAQRATETHGPAVHLIVASGGNAGLAVACAANALNVKCSVYLPIGAAQNTLDTLRRQGAEVVVTGRFYAEALQAAQTQVDREPHAVGGGGLLGGLIYGCKEIGWDDGACGSRSLEPQSPT
ncbi:hypothetical protein C0995_012723 [Termitomyces sp. Mi166|nr:hypothetical protein C0995_012723 [Termitomyces sp. Mi166\